MKQTSVLRITAGICFYYSVLSAISVSHAWRLPMALFAGSCLLLGFLIVRCASPVLRLLLAALPALCFLTGPFRLLMIFPAVAWVYYFLIMARGHYVMPLVEYRRAFTWMLAVSLFFIAANIANSTLYTNQLISVDSLVYTGLFLLLGILAMRRMQMGADMPLNWQLKNLLSVVGVPLLAVGASLILFLVLRFSGLALGAVLTPIGRFFVWLFNRLFPAGNRPVSQMSLQEYLFPKPAAQVAEEMGGDEVASTVMDDGSYTNPYLVERAAVIGGWGLLALLLLLVLALIWRHTKRSLPDEEEDALYEETEAAPAGQRKRNRRGRAPLLASNARQLRRIYKTWLEYRKGKGVSVYPSDTSAEILNRASASGGTDDEKTLRELYLAARYGDPSAVTRDQVLEAQACLERITGKT